MPPYRVVLTSSSAREIEKLPARVVARIVQRLENLALDPRPSGCKKMRGGDNEWRIRIGDYRAVYTIDDAKQLIDVTRIRHRKEVYEG